MVIVAGHQTKGLTIRNGCVEDFNTHSDDNENNDDDDGKYHTRKINALLAWPEIIQYMYPMSE